MELAIIDKKKKTLYGIMNASILSFTILWIIIFALLFINIEVASRATAYLMLLSVLPLLSGLLSLAILALSGNRLVEFDERRGISLTLNLSEADFKSQKFDNMGQSGNFVAVHKLSTEYEISSAQAKKLLLQEDRADWQITLQERKAKVLTESPKQMFNSAMGILWSAS
jgi:Leucine-rich repeat (LRR) protein